MAARPEARALPVTRKGMVTALPTSISRTEGEQGRARALPSQARKRTRNPAGVAPAARRRGAGRGPGSDLARKGRVRTAQRWLHQGRRCGKEICPVPAAPSDAEGRKEGENVQCPLHQILWVGRKEIHGRALSFSQAASLISWSSGSSWAAARPGCWAEPHPGRSSPRPTAC